MSLQSNTLRLGIRQAWFCLSVTFLSSIAACAQVRMAGFDNTTGVVRYCGNAHAYHDEVVAAARADCAAGRRLETQLCNTEPTGNGHRATSISQKYGECCEFKCEAMPK